MALDDPKVRVKPEPVEEPSMAALMATFGALLLEIRGSKNEDTKERLTLEAERLLVEQQRLTLEQDRASREMQENKRNPQISVYSYPEGNLKREKPTLKTKIRWVGFDEREELLTPAEIDALNTLQPGDYFVTKADGARMPFKVSAKYADVFDEATNRPKLEELSIWFPCRGEHRQNHLSKISYCTQAMTGALPNVDDLLAQVAILKAELARDRSSVVGAL